LPLELIEDELDLGQARSLPWNPKLKSQRRNSDPSDRSVIGAARRRYTDAPVNGSATIAAHAATVG
jgi:hypothetical protein